MMQIHARTKRVLIALGLSLLLVLAFDATGWDLPMAHWHGDQAGFYLRDHPMYARWLYTDAKNAALLGLVVLAALCVWPRGPWRAMPKLDRWALLASVVLVILAVPALKSFSMSACPWDLGQFNHPNDSVVPYISHWDFSRSDPFQGHCFPGGHAVTGFGFFPIVFALWPINPRQGAWALAMVLTLGFAFGLAQQIRGAHFMSHTLWSAWLCAALATALHGAWHLAKRTWLALAER